MKRISSSVGLFVLVSACVSGSAMAAQTTQAPIYSPQLHKIRFMPEDPMIKVLLNKNQEGFMVEVKGPHNIYDPYTGRRLEAAFTGSSYYMSPTSDGIKWGQEFPGVYQILIVPDEPSSGVFVNGIAYPGTMAFYEVDMRLAAVSWTAIDDFVSSIFSTNFLPSSTDQKEALAAYAIALRTRAYQQINSGESPFWDVSAEACGYHGNAIVRMDALYKEAMKSTKKIIMTGAEHAAAVGHKFDRKTIDEIRQQMPMADIEKMAKDGRDARVILHKYYPDQNLVVAGAKPLSTVSSPE